MATAGDRIREIRAKRGMTQDQLAEKAGLSKGFLSDVENNKRNVSSQALLRIANVLAASIDYLLRGEHDQPVADREPVVIPPELSKAAQEMNWSYPETLELLDAYNSVVARRSNRAVRDFTKEDWKKLHSAISKSFG